MNKSKIDKNRKFLIILENGNAKIGVKKMG